jgi:MtfA peptidase
MIFLTLLILLILYVKIKWYLKSKLEVSFHPEAWLYLAKHPKLASILNANPISDEIQLLLAHRFPFYLRLPDDFRHFFNYRLHQLIKSFEFVNMENHLDIDLSLKAVLLVQANRLTLGFKQYKYDAFPIIEIHPDVYYSEMTHHWHKGDTSVEDGVIRLSAKYLNEGDNVSTDGLNLAIHEYAHAVMMELFVGNEREGFFENYVQYKNCALKNLDICKEKALLRSYAYSNDQEFFAVVSEVFFEEPLLIKENVPDLYETLCKLYNQQPDKIIPLFS